MSEQAWPTAEQFDQAHEMGTDFAQAQIKNRFERPRAEPLSGEYADDPTPRSIAREVGFILPGTQDFDAVDELASAWERGYFDAWAHAHIEPES